MASARRVSEKITRSADAARPPREATAATSAPAAAPTPSAPSTASAASATALGILLARSAGVLFVEDVEGSKAHVGDFLFGEHHPRTGCGVIERQVCCGVHSGGRRRPTRQR